MNKKLKTFIAITIALFIITCLSTANAQTYYQDPIASQAYRDYFRTNRVDFNRAIALFGYENAPTAAFISSRSGITLDRIHLVYRTHRRDWFTVISRLGLHPDILFVDVPPSYRIAGPYGTPYGHWRRRRTNPAYRYTLTGADIGNLVHLNIIHGYYGTPVVDIIRYRSEGRPFTWIVRNEHQRRIKKPKHPKNPKHHYQQPVPQKPHGKKHYK